VSQLTAQIREVLEEVFENVLVVGEVSNAKLYNSGHWYFSLKDKDATLPCVCFKTFNTGLRFKLEDGMQVVLRGKLNVYPPRGAYQLVASSIEPVGIGEWQLAFEQLKEKLSKEGLLDPERKRPIPILPRCVGVVTSTAGAALRDILSALARRNKLVNVVIAPAKVQGEGSAEDIAHAIRELQRIPDVDVILVARGGGSIEDLWSFNTELVARAVSTCSVPVISGVGHETDITICDLVADLRAPTPTAAAEMVARGSAELLDRWQGLEKRLVYRMEDRIARARHVLHRVDPINGLLRYHERLKRNHLKVLSYRDRMTHRMAHSLNSAEHKWRQNHEKLSVLGPKNVLSRGFSILRKLDGQIVRTYEDVKPGDILEGILFQGRLKLRVEEVEPEP
jgi:exodeoxyribonuclease VII large subunit